MCGVSGLSPSATLSSTTVIFSSSSSRFFKNLTNTPLVKPLELSSKASASWHLARQNTTFLHWETKTVCILFWMMSDVLNLRGVSKDNVGRNPQDDVWSAVIMVISGFFIKMQQHICKSLTGLLEQKIVLKAPKAA